MSVKLHKVRKRNPRDMKEVKYHLAQSRRGTIDFNEAAKDIAHDEDMSEGNVYSTLIGLTRHLSRYLKNGDSVRLGNFGSFHLSVQSDGKSKPEELSTHDVKHVKVVFVAGVDLKQELEHISFEVENTPLVEASEHDLAGEA